ncbi:hypothetical protein [Roseateles oligotrophus]|uniref:Uncharacterized protein n=1 Tax=Roseateles oligotrophus TaxID=1769250 RepID=A0ABT2YJU2_9BURK|nr:hypothetical protein [Roseateles oligotrophus]MCV2370272.1 hypothetical protein [Roseateles oligotrophus]
MFNFIHPKPLLPGRAVVVQMVQQSALRASLPSCLIARAEGEKPAGKSLPGPLLGPQAK